MQREWSVTVAGFAVAAAALALGIASVWPFLADDALISLRFSTRLADGAGLTWSDGEPAEGYSNLLWVLVCAAACKLGVPPLAAMRSLGVLCTGLMLLAIAMRFRGSGVAVAAAAFLAVAAPLATWTIGGLEMPLLLLLLTMALLAAERAFAASSPRRWLVVGIWLAGTAVTRPDGPLFAVVVAIAAWLLGDRRGRPSACVALLGPVALAVAAQSLFRVLYHGDWLPNTARVKLGADPAGGLAYLAGSMWPLRALLATSTLGAVLAWRGTATRPFAGAMVAVVVAWSAYVVAIGGDFFPAMRLLVPLLAPLGLLTGLALAELWRRGRRLLASGLALAAIALTGYDTANEGIAARTAEDRWVHEGLAIGSALRDAFAAQRPLLAVDAAGAVPFASGFPAIDMFGLCDAATARGRDAVASPARVRAHRRADAEYLLGRRPDAFLFGQYPGVPFPEESAIGPLLEDPRFVANYRCVWFDAGDGVSSEVPLWMALEGRLGVQGDGNRLELPAWFVGSWQMVPGMRLSPPSDPEALAQWHAVFDTMYPWGHAVAAHGGVWLEVREASEYRCRGLVIPSGDFDVRVEPVVPGVRAHLVDEAEQGAEAGSSRRVSVVLAVDSATWPVRLRTVVLERR